LPHVKDAITPGIKIIRGISQSVLTNTTDEHTQLL